MKQGLQKVFVFFTALLLPFWSLEGKQTPESAHTSVVINLNKAHLHSA